MARRMHDRVAQILDLVDDGDRSRVHGAGVATAIVLENIEGQLDRRPLGNDRHAREDGGRDERD